MRSDRAIEQYVKDCEYRQLSPHTIARYRWALDRMSSEHEYLPTNPSQMKKLISGDKLAPETRHALWRSYRTFFRWVAREGIAHDPMENVVAPKVRQRFPRTLSVGEIKQLFVAAQNPRDRAIIAVLLDTGMRVAELAGLTWQKVSSYGVEIYGKTGSRFVPLSTQSQQLIEGLGDGHHIWTGHQGPLTVDGVQQAVRRIMYRARILPPKAGPHLLRHTFGRLYMLNGGDVFSLQRLLGHANISSTMIYVHMSNRDLIEQHRRYNPLRNFKVLMDSQGNMKGK